MKQLATLARKMYNKAMKLRVKEQLKTLMAQEGLRLKELAEIISEQTGKKYSPGALSQKLNRETFTYNEILMIADMLDYDIIFAKREN